jgi:pimeloyl-ACP methyl ester carboxylesterase
VTIEGLTIHFVHEKSGDPDAIPLILNHGWPGTFLEFIPDIEGLTAAANTSTGKAVSFDVVIPSLPGFAFSSPPPANWTVDDTARVFNTLMTHVLGYDKYAVHGTDWGSGVAYSLYNNFNTTARALHLNFLPFFPLTPDQLAAENITLTPEEELEAQETAAWSSSGNGYFVEQVNRVSARAIHRLKHHGTDRLLTSQTQSALRFTITRSDS